MCHIYVTVRKLFVKPLIVEMNNYEFQFEKQQMKWKLTSIAGHASTGRPSNFIRRLLRPVRLMYTQ